MERSPEMDLRNITSPLGFFERLELAKAHCAIVFEERGGKLTDADVTAVARRWTIAERERAQLDADLLAGHLYAWLG
jgi:hypothetical protein